MIWPLISVGLGFLLVVASVAVVLLARSLPRRIAEMVHEERRLRAMTDIERNALIAAAQEQMARILRAARGAQRPAEAASVDPTGTAAQRIEALQGEDAPSPAAPVPTTKPDRPSAGEGPCSSDTRMFRRSDSAAASGGRACSRPDEPPPRSDEDEARIAARVAARVAEAAARGQPVGHCDESGLCTGDRTCLCGCDLCLEWLGIREQAEADLLQAGLRAAALVRPQDTRRRTSVCGVPPASSPTLASMQAVRPVADRAVAKVEIEEAPPAPERTTR